MSVNKITQEIENLITPLAVKAYSIEDAFFKKTTNMGDYSFRSLQQLEKVLEPQLLQFNLQDLPSWLKFVKVILDKLMLLKNEVESDDGHLFSLSQQRILKSCIEIVVCLGILPHLKEGVGVPLNQRMPNHCSFLQKETTEGEKFYALNLTLLALFELFTLDTFNSILINHHLGDMIAGAVQLILDNKCADTDLIKQHLRQIIENTYQPFVIRALMIMLGNKGIPKKLFRWLSSVLSERLTAKGGLVSTLRAILDITGGSKESPYYWQHISVLAKLITTPKHASIYPQLFELMRQSSEYRQVAIMSLKLLLLSRPEDNEKYFISPLLQKITAPCTEAEFGEALDTLHACCGFRAPWTISPQILHKTFRHIIRLHAKIKSSVSYLKLKAADLAWAILSDKDSNLEDIFSQAVFSNLTVVYNFGPEGGVYVTSGDDEIEAETVADSIVELFLIRENSEAKINLFNMLISSITKDNSLEKQLIYSKLLSDVCADADVQKSLSENPLCVIPFMKVLLESAESYGAETVCLGLMVLGIVVDTPLPQNPIEWEQLDILIEPLKNFKCSSTETNVLANELYELIMSKGVIRKNPKKPEKIKTSLEKALEEAVDPLLPVRAHGIRELGKLLYVNDPQAMAKKESILFIFKENLKDEDSYVYLSSIEGIAALSASFPDEVLITLIEEYQGKGHSLEDRLKVGEVLVKVARILNEMAIVYKRELINCFLVGCCDDEPLMRASSLSNLGEICKVLSFRITSYIVEILEYIRSIYETDKYPEARRAAVMVLTLLLKGLGDGALSTLEPVLLELYRGLKKVYEYDKDDITRLHAQLALEELRASTLVFLNPLRPLEKKIFVLDPPE